MRPFLLLLDGPMGSGKTAAAEILHQHFPRTALLGLDRLKWTVSDFKRNRRNNAMIYEVVQAMAQTFLRNKINVIVEQGFRQGLAEEFVRLGKRTKARIIIVSLTAPRQILLDRVRQRMKTPMAKTQKPIAWSRVLRNMRVFAQRKPLGGPVINTERLTPAEVAQQVTTIMKSS